MNTWGRFTVRGSNEVEQRISTLVTEIADKSKCVLKPDDYRAMVLIGGYGRGEGGVEIIGGEECPHNNLDFLIIANKLSPDELSNLKHRIDENIAPLSAQYDIGLDVSIIPFAKLKHSPCLVMWYDMRFGHKTILGDSELLHSLHQFSLDRIVAYDMRNLLVNRGTLPVINEMLLERGDLSQQEKKLFVKHIMKSIIGYGDALLFFHGAYDWSYAEKQKQMRRRSDIDADFQSLYDQAMEFRFQPDYSRYLNIDFTQWLDGLREKFSAIHLFCESRRLSIPTLTWENYMQYALGSSLREDIFSFRGFAKKLLNGIRSKPCPQKYSLINRLGYRCCGNRGRLPLFFPLIAYHLLNPSFNELVRLSFNAKSTTIDDLRNSYLNEWSKFGDENFPAVLRKLRIQLN
jgi:hypothetical protein